MWVNFRYLFDECFQQDDIRVTFDENIGMYYLPDEPNDLDLKKVIHIKANSYNVEIKEITRKEYNNREITHDWENFEINAYFSISSLWTLYYKYLSEPFLLSDVEMTDDLESSGENDESGEDDESGEPDE